jgi:hypothetical protein
MGAIARNIANNITTSGVFTSSAITNSSVTGITVLANASDGITFISSQTASNSSSLSFTGLSSTYKAYKFVFSSLHPRTDGANFQLNLSTDSGSNYNVTKTSVFFRAGNYEDGSTGFVQYTDYDLSQSTANALLTEFVGSGADESLSGSCILFNPSSTTYVKHWISVVNRYSGDDGSFNTFCNGYGNTTSAINAIRFSFDAQATNFDGTIYMYGIK